MGVKCSQIENVFFDYYFRPKVLKMRIKAKKNHERGDRLENKVKNKRKELGLTQLYVAEKAGIKRSYYNQIENGHRKGSLKVWLAISKILDIPEREIATLMKDRMKNST